MENKKTYTNKQVVLYTALSLLALFILITAVVLLLTGLVAVVSAKNADEGNYESAIKNYKMIEDFPGIKQKLAAVKYDYAIDLVHDGNYASALRYFDEAGDYKDAKKRYEKCREEMYVDAMPGDVISFGDYHNNYQWIVLEREDDNVLLLSKYIVELQPYNDTKKIVTWELSYIRKWLNGTYYEQAFSEDEQDRIYIVSMDNDGNSVYGTDGGNDTEDFVFLLSSDEVKEYLGEKKDRCAGFENGENINWWLRTPGNFSNAASVVREDGSVTTFGNSVDKEIGVRPAIWVDISDM